MEVAADTVVLDAVPWVQMHTAETSDRALQPSSVISGHQRPGRESAVERSHSFAFASKIGRTLAPGRTLKHASGQQQRSEIGQLRLLRIVADGTNQSSGSTS